jgi:chaperone required for assembly of F1-ATPase
MAGHTSASRGFELSRLDEAYQIEQWGEDEDAKARTELIRAETLALAKLI